ncbi:MAG: DUF554 domain-containing protein [Acidaminococcaceae bacterium]
MMGMGTLVNVGAILVGATLGLMLKQGLPAKVQGTIMQGIGLAIAVIGIQMALQTNNMIIVILSLVCGALVGESLDLDKGLNRCGDWLGSKIAQKRATGATTGTTISEGFVAASLIYCVGAMAIVGSIQEGLTGNATTLYAKASLDGLTAIIFTANMGVGVAFSALSVGLYQGSLTLLASSLESVMTPAVLAEVTATGGILIIAIALNMLKIQEIRLANLLPAIFFAGIFVELFILFR